MPEELEETETTEEAVIAPITLQDIATRLDALDAHVNERLQDMASRLNLIEENNARLERERTTDAGEQPTDTSIPAGDQPADVQPEERPTTEEPIKRPNRQHRYFRKLW